ncbi:MAG: glycosyltransferase family 2 protein [Planctomycetes bacterium]|nr:glycosyltransferase family 2 protein [Planctomycetota bacterium]
MDKTSNGNNHPEPCPKVLINDVVADKNSLRKLVEAGRTDERIGVIAPVVYSYHNPVSIQCCGYRINYWIGRLKKLKYGRDIFVKESDTVSEVDSQIGCANLIKVVVFKEIGLFRRIYDIYFEETDFNVRAWRNNFRVVVVKDAKVCHKAASTMNKYIMKRAYLLLRNLFIFELLNAGMRHLMAFVPYFFLVHVPYFLVYGSVYGLNVKFKDTRNKYGGVTSKIKSV